MPDLSLVILAAGIGTRYGGLKQLDPVGPGGEPVMAYSIHDAIKAGFGRVVFIVRPEIESLLRENVGEKVRDRIETSYVHQRIDRLPSGHAAPSNRAKPWGTGHALLCAAEAVNGPFMTVNADDLCGPEAFRLVADALRNADPGGNEHVMVAFSLTNTLSPHGTVSRGVCSVGDDGALVEVVERRKIQEREGEVRFLQAEKWVTVPRDTPVSLNLWGFVPTLFKDLEEKFKEFIDRHGEDPEAEFGLPQTVGALVNEGRISVKVLRSRDRWYGMSYREDLESVRNAVREMTNQGVYPERLYG
jgi:NDP-sugar pyrophosphorylase family protein